MAEPHASVPPADVLLPFDRQWRARLLRGAVFALSFILSFYPFTEAFAVKLQTARLHTMELNCNMMYGDAQAVLVKTIEAVRGLGLSAAA